MSSTPSCGLVEWFDFRVRDVRGLSALTWAIGKRFRIPSALSARTGLSAIADGNGDCVLTADLPRPTAADADSLRMLRAFTEQKPTSSRLPFSYHHLPAWSRDSVAKVIGRWQRRRGHVWGVFPRWPLDLSADLLTDWADPPARSPNIPAPVWLTHDLDSPEGMTSLVESFLPLEEAHSVRSTSFVVPCGWPLDHRLLDQIVARGHDLGMHGFDHSNKGSFLPTHERTARLSAGRDRLHGYGIKGYRSPSLLRSQALLTDLADHFTYDSSVPTSGGPFPIANNGCASARPFRYGRLWEIPLSLPRDGSLRFLGHSPDEILDLWKSCANYIADSGGVVVLLTHCERRFTGTPTMLRAYNAFLDFVTSSPRFRVCSPTELLFDASGLTHKRSA